MGGETSALASGGRRRHLVAVAATVLALAACGGTGGAAPATTSVASTAATSPTTPPSTEPIPSSTIAPAPDSTVPPGTVPASTTTVLTPLPDPGWSEVPADGSAGDVTAWTGTELLVSTGGCCTELSNPDLRRYDPVSRRWSPAARSGLRRRGGINWVWTGSRLIEAGGHGVAPGAPADEEDSCEQPTVPCIDLVDGASYDPATDTWRPIAPMPVPVVDGVTAWTGREMLVWSQDSAAVVGLAYDPAADTWRRLSTTRWSPRTGAVTVWTGSELLVWGGVTDVASPRTGMTVDGDYHADGVAYDVAHDTWRAIPAAPVPARADAAAVWTGSRMVMWGGRDGEQRALGKGAAYDPATDTWTALPLSPLRAVDGPTAIWTGRVMFVAGGRNTEEDAWVLGQAATFDPATNTWTMLDAAPLAALDGLFNGHPLTARWQARGVWTGRQVLTVGGVVETYQAADFGGYTFTPTR